MGSQFDRVERPSAEAMATVRGSLAVVASHPVMLAEVFYGHLFAMAPDTRGMFPEDLTGQMQKMTTTLLAAIAQLEGESDSAELEATLQRLGASHARHYDVEPAHYQYIGHALTRAVRDVAGAAYSGAMSSSWIALVQWVCHHMIEGAEADRDRPVPRGDDTAENAAVVPVPDAAARVPQPRVPEQTGARPGRPLTARFPGGADVAT